MRNKRIEGGGVVKTISKNVTTESFAANNSGNRMMSSKPVAMALATRATPPHSMGTDSDGRMSCAICNRKFAPDRLGVHQKICRKLNARKVEVFDTKEQRTKDFEDVEKTRGPSRGKKKKDFEDVEKTRGPSRGKKKTSSGNSGKYALGGLQQPTSQSSKSSSWRDKHNDFQKKIREAKKVQRFLDKGGDVMDLPPAERDENDYKDYVNCPHCGRNFNQTAGARHIPKCKNIVNKPKPPPNSRAMLLKQQITSTNRYNDNSRIGGRGTQKPWDGRF